MPARNSQALIEVAGWAVRGDRLVLTLHGNAAAVNRLRSQGRLSVQVHWTRTGDDGPSERLTELPVGRPGLVPALAGEVEHQGYFSWHSWVAKRGLGRGGWHLSLTGPDGSPVPCQAQQGPCRFSADTG